MYIGKSNFPILLTDDCIFFYSQNVTNRYNSRSTKIRLKCFTYIPCLRKVLRYQRGNHEARKDRQWSKEKDKKNKQRPTKHYTENYRLSSRNPTTNNDLQNTTQKTKDWAAGTPQQTTTYKTLHRKLRIEQQEPHNKQRPTKHYTEN